MNTKELLLALWPLIAFNMVLMVSALISISRRGKTRKLPKTAWVLIVIFINLFGPIFYFAFGKGEPKDNELYRD